MQAVIGVTSLDELFADIPQKFRLKQIPDIPAALSEQQTVAVMSDLARKNKLPQLTLTGAGAYHHFIPAVVGHIISAALNFILPILLIRRKSARAFCRRFTNTRL